MAIMMNRHKHQHKDNNDKIVAIIGARSGSKSVKDKNIRHLNGQPLIFWIIQTAINTPEIDRVIVSTDSEEYATIARSCGAEVPFIRPEKISGDLSTDFEYVSHCLEYLCAHVHKTVFWSVETDKELRFLSVRYQDYLVDYLAGSLVEESTA